MQIKEPTLRVKHDQEQEFEITVKVKKKDRLRTFYQEIGTSKTDDGKNILLLSTIPQFNMVVAFDGSNYEVETQHVFGAIMSKLINGESEGEGSE